LATTAPAQQAADQGTAEPTAAPATAVEFVPAVASQAADAAETIVEPPTRAATAAPAAAPPIAAAVTESPPAESAPEVAAESPAIAAMIDREMPAVPDESAPAKAAERDAAATDSGASIDGQQALEGSGLIMVETRHAAAMEATPTTPDEGSGDTAPGAAAPAAGGHCGRTDGDGRNTQVAGRSPAGCRRRCAQDPGVASAGGDLAGRQGAKQEERSMPLLLAICLGLAVLLSQPQHAQAQTQRKETKPADYRVGERLPDDRKGAQGYRLIGWDDLMPKGWDPMAAFKGLDLARLQDSDPKAQEALESARRLWDQAPAEKAMSGQKVRIAGFVVPLERRGEQVTEFLLVPYFGACIHVPPPPANQIIHVVAEKPVGGMRTMDAMWVSGTLGLDRTDTGMGVAGYRMRGEAFEAYTRPRS
jgi:hypothetical protein